jgi:thiol-disulfide isomerase/thioredoxin
MVVRNSLTAVLLVISAAVWSAPGAFADDQMPWVEDLSIATQRAAAEGKLVLLHVYSDDCPPCRRLEKNVYSRPDVAEAVARNFVPVRVHAKQRPEIVAKYNVRAWPTDVYLTPTGIEIYKTVCPQEPNDYVNLVNSLAAQTGTGLGRNNSQLPTSQQLAAQRAEAHAAAGNPVAAQAAAAQASLAQGNVPQPTSHVPPATPFGPWVAPGASPRDTIAQVSNQVATQANGQAQWMAQGAHATAQQAQQSFQQTQQAVQQAGQQTWQQAHSQANQTATQVQGQFNQAVTQTVDASQQAVAGATQQATQMANDHTQAAATAAKEVINQYSQPMPNTAAIAATGFAPWQGAIVPPGQQSPFGAVPANPAAAPNASLAPNALLAPSASPAITPVEGGAPPAAAAAPAGTYPIAMEGFCPVTLLSEGKWKKGQPEFGAVHRRRTFLFATAEAQQAFLAGPDRFSPVMVGYDPVKFMNSGELVDGRVTYGLTYRKQIYLFSDDASLKSFWQNPRQFTEGLRQAMTQQERVIR